MTVCIVQQGGESSELSWRESLHRPWHPVIDLQHVDKGSRTCGRHQLHMFTRRSSTYVSTLLVIDKL